jgi:UDP-glucose 6-dehydrogenase
MSDFLNRAEFTKLVEKAVRDNNMSYMDAMLDICDKNNIDPEDVKKFVGAPLQSKLEVEAMELNLLPKKAVLDFG